MNFIVTTDSGCDLPYSLLKERDIIPFPIKYELDGKVHEDTMLHEDCRRFYDDMRKGAVPKTSQINIMEFVDFWRPIAERGLPIVHVCLGSGISGTYDNGLTAVELLNEQLPEAQIHLVDSTLASAGCSRLKPPTCATRIRRPRNVSNGSTKTSPKLTPTIRHPTSHISTAAAESAVQA